MMLMVCLNVYIGLQERKVKWYTVIFFCWLMSSIGQAVFRVSTLEYLGWSSVLLLVCIMRTIFSQMKILCCWYSFFSLECIIFNQQNYTLFSWSTTAHVFYVHSAHKNHDACSFSLFPALLVHFANSSRKNWWISSWWWWQRNVKQIVKILYYCLFVY